jgi:hypothetical protein
MFAVALKTVLSTWVKFGWSLDNLLTIILPLQIVHHLDYQMKPNDGLDEPKNHLACSRQNGTAVFCNLYILNTC